MLERNKFKNHIIKERKSDYKSKNIFTKLLDEISSLFDVTGHHSDFSRFRNTNLNIDKYWEEVSNSFVEAIKIIESKEIK